jgi:CRISPR-associated protein Csx16
MAILLVTRHPGASAWLQNQGMMADRVLAHLEPGDWADGDWVVGVLPYHLAAAVCAAGGRFFSLDVAVPWVLRGAELSESDLIALGARLREYRVEALPPVAAPGKDERGEI